MNVTLATIRDTVRFRGDFQNVRKFTDADVNKEIQSAFAEFYALIAKTHQGYWDVSDTVSTVTSQAYVALPATAWRVQSIDRLDGTEYFEMMQVGIADRNRYGSNTAQPCAYRLSARGIEMLPVPDAIYTLRVNFTPYAPALQESQPRDYGNGWEDFCVTGALLRLDQREQRPLGERMAVMNDLRARILDEAGERRQQEPEYLALREVGGLFDRSSWDDGVW